MCFQNSAVEIAVLMLQPACKLAAQQLGTLFQGLLAPAVILPDILAQLLQPVTCLCTGQVKLDTRCLQRHAQAFHVLEHMTEGRGSTERNDDIADEDTADESHGNEHEQMRQAFRAAPDRRMEGIDGQQLQKSPGNG